MSRRVRGAGALGPVRLRAALLLLALVAPAYALLLLVLDDDVSLVVSDVAVLATAAGTLAVTAARTLALHGRARRVARCLAVALLAVLVGEVAFTARHAEVLPVVQAVGDPAYLVAAVAAVAALALLARDGLRDVGLAVVAHAVLLLAASGLTAYALLVRPDDGVDGTGGSVWWDVAYVLLGALFVAVAVAAARSRRRWQPVPLLLVGAALALMAVLSWTTALLLRAGVRPEGGPVEAVQLAALVLLALGAASLRDRPAALRPPGAALPAVLPLLALVTAVPAMLTWRDRPVDDVELVLVVVALLAARAAHLPRELGCGAGPDAMPCSPKAAGRSKSGRGRWTSSPIAR